MNERIRDMQRAEDFNLPWCDGAFFPNHVHAQAKEHRNMMQVLPFILWGIDDELAEVACRCVCVCVECLVHVPHSLVPYQLDNTYHACVYVLLECHNMFAPTERLD